MPSGDVHLTPQFVQAVREAVDIVSIAGDHTRLTKAGRRWEGLCPLHKEKTPSFSVDPVQGLFYCFGCGRGGDAIKLHMEITGDDFPAAIETLANKFGIPIPTRTERPGDRRADDLRAVLDAAAEFFSTQLTRHDAPQTYLARRKVPADLVRRFGLGYAPDDWRTLHDALRLRFPVPLLEAAGLLTRSERNQDRPYDRFRHRLMFPIRNPSGRIVGFGGRTLGDDKAKYINTAETGEFHKSQLLYGLDLARKHLRESGKVLLVEGYFDVIGAVAAGIEGTVASMGTALTPEQVRLLKRYADDVVVGYDSDNAGENAHRRALPLLLAEGFAVYRARFGAGEDPDSLRLAQGPEAVAAAVTGAVDAVLDEITRLVPPGTAREPQLQARAAKEVAGLLAPIPDAILRHGYAQRAAAALDVPVDMLARRLVRPGEGGPAPRPAPPSTPTNLPLPNLRPPGLTRSQEDTLLARLLQNPSEAPPLERLPPEEAFFDAVCRNIFRALRVLYEEHGVSPAAREVVAALGSDGSAVTRVAQYQNEAEYEAGGRPLSIGECLEAIHQRWGRERLRELRNEIDAASRRNDPPERVAALLDEKDRLSRSHFGARGTTSGPRR